MNACETGLLIRADDRQGVLWTGIALAFIAVGAVNYIGSLWRVSTRVAADR
jgi:CHAT domain-containing protein